MMHCSFETQFIKILNHIFRNYKKICKFSLKMSIFCNIYVVDEINNWCCRKFEEKFQLTIYTLLVYVYDLEFTTKKGCQSKF